MKKHRFTIHNIRKTSSVALGLALTGALFLAACSPSSSGNASATTADQVAATTASETGTTTATDGKAELDRLRELAETNVQQSVGQSSLTAQTATVDTAIAELQKPHADSNDDDIDTSDATTVSFDGSSVTAQGSNSSSVSSQSGSVTISAAGTYLLTGTYSGTVKVSVGTEDKVNLVLNNVTITSENDSAIYIEQADEVRIVTQEGTTNTLTDAGSYQRTEGATGTIASNADLTLGGNGTLKLTSQSTQAISSSDGLVILGGTIAIDSVDDGIRGKDYVVIADGDITTNASGDGIQSTNGDDAGRGYVLITGGKVTESGVKKAIDTVGMLLLDGGEITADTSGDSLESQFMVLAAGSATITSGDDGLNATDGSGGDMGMGPMQQSGESSSTIWAAITGGNWTFTTQGDGIDSNGDLHMSGGTLIVYGPENDGNGAIDVQNGMTISGGRLVAVGSSGMAEAPLTSSEQASVMFSTQVAAGSQISIADESGSTLFTLTVPKTASNIVVSDPAITQGSTYQLLVAEKAVATAEAGSYTQLQMGMGGAPGVGGPAGGAGAGGPGGAMPNK